MSASKTYLIPTAEDLAQYRNAVKRGYSVILEINGRNTKVIIRKPPKAMKRK